MKTDEEIKEFLEKFQENLDGRDDSLWKSILEIEKEKRNGPNFPIKDDAQSKVSYAIYPDPMGFSLENYVVNRYSNPMYVIFGVGNKKVGYASLIKDNRTESVYLGFIEIFNEEFKYTLDNDEELQVEFANCLNRMAEKLDSILENYGYTFEGPINGKIETNNININKKI